ncbi:unnamed protein product [Mycena citricolor]|uniref:Nuclear condensin complex subunit 3 C-terminal domain-containing protein n=1 Tax=Mycena citricolor TaxID=2018698 RepID=A0AAD2GXU1_9AGAR|nr:unnamed protein product [Mycena citricolor]
MLPRPPTDNAQKLREQLSGIFDQVQTSLANHRKNYVALHKIHSKAEQGDFVEVFLECVSRIMSLKKGPAVDRVGKFIGGYVKFVNEKVNEEKEKLHAEKNKSISAGGNDDADEDTLASVFVAAILEWIMQGFVAKNKVVRYQAVHLVAEMIAFLGEIDEESYLSLRSNLVDRSTCDKEAPIRAQAVSALSRLIGSEDNDELEDGEKSILEVLLEVMSTDPSPEVRRAALMNVPLTPTTLPALLDRTRDVDAVTRKLVYSGVFTPRLENPRMLSIGQRETLVRAGLGDREPAVRLAAGKMVGHWYDGVLADPSTKDDGWNGDDGGVMRALVSLLGLFDVVGPGEAIAVDALASLFTTRPELYTVFVFEDSYWQNLTPESAILARVFHERCLAEKRDSLLEDAGLPVVTAFAFHIQEGYNQLLSALEAAEVARALGTGDDDEDSGAEEEEMAIREAVLGDLLRMAVKLDYMDEIGRRKVYTVSRDMLAHAQLPPGLIPLCQDVMKEILPTERELIRVNVEIIMDLLEPEQEEQDVNDNDTTTSDATFRKERSLRRAKTREDMSPDEAMSADLTDLRCLEICISMLERVHGASNFEDNSTLEGILADLIIPAVRRKEVGIREKGVVSLGLCCLIAKACYHNIAVKSLQLFLSQIQGAPPQLKLKLLQIVFDLMVLYDQQLWGRPEDGQAILGFLCNLLQVEESDEVQAVLCVGLAKLLLAGLVSDEGVIKTLLVAYVSPYTTGNTELRQCLSYFFSVYCYSAPENQRRVQKTFMAAFDAVVKMHDELDDEQTMVTPQQFGELVIDWLDAGKVAEVNKTAAAGHAQSELAADILEALYDEERREEDQQALCTFLAYLHPEQEAPLTPRLLVKLSALLQHVQTQCDPSLAKAVAKFSVRFNKEFGDAVASVDWAEYGTDEMKKLYDWMNVDVPDYGQTGVEKKKSSRTKKPKPDDEEEEQAEDEEVSESPEEAPVDADLSEQEEAKPADEEDAIPDESNIEDGVGSELELDTEPEQEQEQEQEQEEDPEPEPEPEPEPASKTKGKGKGKASAKFKAQAEAAEEVKPKSRGRGSRSKVTEEVEKESPSVKKRSSRARVSQPAEEQIEEQEEAAAPRKGRSRSTKATEERKLAPKEKKLRGSIASQADAEESSAPRKSSRKRARTPDLKPESTGKRRKSQKDSEPEPAVASKGKRASSRRKPPADGSEDELGAYDET